MQIETSMSSTVTASSSSTGHSLSIHTDTNVEVGEELECSTLTSIDSSSLEAADDAIAQGDEVIVVQPQTQM